MDPLVHPINPIEPTMYQATCSALGMQRCVNIDKGPELVQLEPGSRH